MLRMTTALAIALSVATVLASARWSAARDESEEILTVDHFVSHLSTNPAIAGQHAQLYVRERVQAEVAQRSPSFVGKVVLFVHGGELPGEVQFDLPHRDHSWMAYLAQAGLDTFAVDLTGYGPSTRPAAMDDPCNADPQSQALLIPDVLREPCSPSYAFLLNPISADVDDVAAAVDYLRGLRGVDRLHLVGWSQGGRRAMKYAAEHPEQVDKLVLGAPVYDPSEPSEPPTPVPASGTSLAFVTRDGLQAAWDRQLGCEDQFEPGIRDVIWREMLQTDSVGATWGPGVVRRPSFMLWGANRETAAKIQAPTLLVSGELDDNSPRTRPERTRQLQGDLGTRHSVFLDVACSSHYAIWETRHRSFFQASAEWLLQGSVNGMHQGAIRIGD